MSRQEALTKPDSTRCSVIGRRNSRLDATLLFQNLCCDVNRLQLKYATRYFFVIVCL